MKCSLFFLVLLTLTVKPHARAETLSQQLRANLRVERYELPNGLTVVLHQDDAIPMVSYHQWFRVGSSAEKPGRTGLAHFFEHLMFKGSKNYSGEKYEALINGNGGYNNAFTTRDYTGYYTLIPSDRLQDIINVEADRLVNLVFDEKQIQSEREVVKEERRFRYDNDPDGTLYLLTYQTVFKKSPYSWPVIGSMSDLNAAKLQEFNEFYKTYYAPNNAIVVVTGGFDLGKTKKWIEAAYGKIPRQTVPEMKATKEPAQKSNRVLSKKMEVQAPKLTMAYLTVDAFQKDVYALQAMASLLGGGNSSRLYKKLVREKQMVTAVEVDQSSGQLEGVFSITMDLRPGTSSEELIGVVESEIQNLQKAVVKSEELEKVKNQVLLGYTQPLKTAAGKARLFAYSEVMYRDPVKVFDDVDLYSEVSALDIQRVAKTYLQPQQKSVISILPKK